MSNTVNKLRNIHLQLYAYINEVRGKGKTSLLKQGIDNYDKSFLLLTVNQSMAKDLTKNKKCKIVTLNSIERLIGSDKPIIIDQEAIAKLSFETAKVLRNQSEMLDHLMSLSEQYQTAYHEYVRITLEYLDTEWWQFRKRSRLTKELLAYKEIDLFPKNTES
jgi:hypothetical protein